MPEMFAFASDAGVPSLRSLGVLPSSRVPFPSNGGRSAGTREVPEAEEEPRVAAAAASSPSHPPGAPGGSGGAEPAMGTLSVSTAFWEHLRRLCLDQFPCGTGSWNKSRLPQKKPQASCSFVHQQPSGSLGNGLLLPPLEETVEALTEFLRSPGCPWALPADCSPEDQQLRELAVRSPQLIQDSFIFLYFKSLRIVNKGVNEIDANLLRFPNLEEVILSANHISAIDSTRLPQTLKVLELCGNEVTDLKDLCLAPPPELQHLGLGHNCQLGSSEEKFLTDVFWPNLVSLDLSYNNFTDLPSLLSKLFTLKKLRLLILQGNPMALIPGYRGFTIDSLPKLCALDDVNITPDERHEFLGLAGNPGLLRHEAQIVISVGKLRGVPNPVGPEDPESGPDAPVITYSYYVTYEFAKGEDREKAKEGLEGALSLPPKRHSRLLKSSMSIRRSTPVIAESLLMPPQETGDKGPTTGDSPLKPDTPAQIACVHATLRKPWSETIECEYRKEHITRDLVALKAYLLAGTTVSVVEEKVVSWPVIVTPVEIPGKKGKGKAEKGRKDKGKEDKGKAKDGGKGSNSKKKKKKSPSPDLRSDPPVTKTLGSGHVGLESLLAGQQQIATVCDFGVLITELSVSPPSPKDRESKKGKNKEKKSRPGTESTTNRKTPNKGKGKNRESLGVPEDLSQPVPLTVEFQVQHRKWLSASQVLIKPKIFE